MRESKTLEFKQSISNTFLKTVSAFANYGSGEIIFGITDDGSIVGIDDPVQACLDIENKINDTIDPIPYYTLSINDKNKLITLKVEEGHYKPYLYKAKAYRRNDSATIEVDRLELTRLILDGQNMSYEEVKSKNQNLSFGILEKKMIEELKIKNFSLDVLKSLDLYKEDTGYNNAALLLADTNDFPGIDSAIIGDNINIIKDRECFSNESILRQYDKIVTKFRKYYEYEEITGAKRDKFEMIPEIAFREVIANALVHRTWDVYSHILVKMYNDRIEISSPGGLVKGITKEAYLDGGISICRNPIIATVFLRLKMIERFGTGIRRINESYNDSDIKPTFNIQENLIQVILPVIKKNITLSNDQRQIVYLLQNRDLSSSELVEITGFGKTKTIKLLNELCHKGYIVKTGNGRGTKYKLNSYK